jgi:hypothetical protein
MQRGKAATEDKRQEFTSGTQKLKGNKKPKQKKKKFTAETQRTQRKTKRSLLKIMSFET